MFSRSSHAQAGDLAHLVGPRHQTMTVQLAPGGRVETMHGILQHDDIIGTEWGHEVNSHLGKPFTVLQPALDDILRDLERNTQVIYPKDIGYILLSLGIGPGSRVLEAGTGSGALTVALAFAAGPEGQVVSYERNPKAQAVARANLQRLGLAERVLLKEGDIENGIDETDMQAVFLDLPNPEEYLQQAWGALQPGGFFGSLLPTTNQVSALVAGLKRHDFGYLEVSEILHRYYQPVATRLRPQDTMNAHTGYLVFARKLAPGQSTPDAKEEN